MGRLDEGRLPDDWLALSSEVLSEILTEAAVGFSANLVPEGDLGRLRGEAIRSSQGPPHGCTQGVSLCQERRRVRKRLDG